MHMKYYYAQVCAERVCVSRVINRVQNASNPHASDSAPARAETRNK